MTVLFLSRRSSRSRRAEQWAESKTSDQKEQLRTTRYVSHLFGGIWGTSHDNLFFMTMTLVGGDYQVLPWKATVTEMKKWLIAQNYGRSVLSFSLSLCLSVFLSSVSLFLCLFVSSLPLLCLSSLCLSSVSPLSASLCLSIHPKNHHFFSLCVVVRRKWTAARKERISTRRIVMSSKRCLVPVESGSTVSFRTTKPGWVLYCHVETDSDACITLTGS